MTEVEVWDRAHLWRYRATLWRIIDGDTFVALPDVGFDGGAFPRIRLLDYDAAEHWQEGGMSASTALHQVLTRHSHLTWPLRIESLIRQRVVEDTKSFDRYVARVWVVTPYGQMLDVVEMLRSGAV